MASTGAVFQNTPKRETQIPYRHGISAGTSCTSFFFFDIATQQMPHKSSLRKQLDKIYYDVKSEYKNRLPKATGGR